LKIENIFPSLSERLVSVVLIGFALLFLLAAFYTDKDARVIDRKIESRQAELGRIIRLKDLYLARKHNEEKGGALSTQKPVLSLGTMEDLVTKVCANGRLVMLKPSVFKEDRRVSTVVEAKIAGVPFKEMIAFVDSVESSGLMIKKLQITTPQGGGETLLDLYTVIAER
jgi:hypothetical protein